MIIIITGASHTGKTLLAQRMLEKYKYPYLSADHLKMGLIRSGNTDLTPEDDDALTEYLWPIVREMIKTAIENKQNLIVEGCYIPFGWRRDFSEEYLADVRFICLAFTDAYADAHFEDIKAHASDIEARLCGECDIEEIKADNRRYAEGFRAAGERVALIDGDYEEAINAIINFYGGSMTIETERLILRPWEESDAEDLYEYAKDERVGPAAGWEAHTSVENSREIIRIVLSAPETYAVCLKEDNRPIGSIGLFKPEKTDGDIADGDLEVGFWVAVPFWGNGYIPEAVRALQKRAFTELGCEALWCGYYEGNAKSKRAQEKCGFVYHHTVPDKPCRIPGVKHTEYMNRLTKEDWLRSGGRE